MADHPASPEKTRIDVEVPEVPVMVHAQYIKDFSFENPNAPDSLRPAKAPPQMDVNIMLDASRIEDPQNPELYESSLSLTVKATRDGKTMFIAQLVYAALVTIKDAPADRINPILFIDVPGLLFPFARQVIASATGSGGYPPLQLNPIDFRGMYMSQRKDGNQTLETVGNA